MTRMKRIGSIGLAVVAVLAIIFLWLYVRLSGAGGPRLPTESELARESQLTSLPVLVTLKPGTVIDNAPTKGWTNAIIKTITFVESGDVDTLPAFAQKTASRFRTVIMADVRKGGPRDSYGLHRVGVGLCLDLKGKDTVISSATLKQQKVELGTVDGLVLGRAEKAIGRSHLAARTSSFALYDTFVELMDQSGAHHSIILRYALVLDSKTGEIRTVYWTMAEKPERRQTPEAVVLISPGSEFHCGIHIAARRVFGRLAASWGFAMVKLPPGKSIAMTPELKELGLQEDFSGDARELETLVREVLGDQENK